MTNWPNIQEYRNFEAKFINDPTNYLSIDPDVESGSVVKSDYKVKNSLDDFLCNNQYQDDEGKTVRCVILKDFEEAFKKLDRGDGVGINQEATQVKPQQAAAVNQLLVDQIRLQNHLKWKKQKDEEYVQKKEAEKLAQQKKKEEELRLERIKKQKEKEREEKLREWQVQKTREKEERKKEKMVMKVLEEELKVTPTVDKEKLIGEWVKLKDKQKQIEAEKKAELQKKEEESKELRQNLAKLSYKKWKESIKGRMMTLPKNGYQIFGPKPTPVVKEDWNHDFTSSSPRNQSLRHTRSNTSTFLTFRAPLKELDDFSKNVLSLDGLKSRSPSYYNLRTAKSGVSLFGNGEVSQSSRWKLPAKESQQETVDSENKNAAKTSEYDPEEKDDFISQYLNKTLNVNFNSKLNGKKNTYSNQCLPNFLGSLLVDGDQNGSEIPKQSKSLLQDFPDHQILPSKKKLDLYINIGSNNGEKFSAVDHQKKPHVKVTRSEEKKEVKEVKEKKKISKEAVEIKPKEKFCVRPPFRSTSLHKQAKNAESSKNLKKPEEDTKSKVCRKSRSCEKSVKKFSKDPAKVKYSSSSRSLSKVNKKVNGSSPEKVAATRSMTCFVQKKKSKKQLKPETPAPSAEKSEKKAVDVGSKANKKPKKPALLKSLSFVDSPYNAKNTSKNMSKAKVRRKPAKEGETRSDVAERGRKLSTTKI